MSDSAPDTRRQDFVFFFQAEDGIRDLTVTGVQTCALPILEALLPAFELLDFIYSGKPQAPDHYANNIHGYGAVLGSPVTSFDRLDLALEGVEIGRASCRERVEISVVAVSLKKKNHDSIGTR